MTDKLETTEATSEEMGTSGETGESTEITTEAAGDAGTSNDNSDDAGETGTSEEDQWLVPNRFKSPEDVLKAYHNLEAAFGRSQSELQKLRDGSRTTIDPAQRAEQFAQALKQDPVRAIEDLARAPVNEIREEFQEREFTRYYQQCLGNDEFRRLEPVMTQIANEYRDLISNLGVKNDPRIINVLFLAAQGAEKEQMKRDAEARGRKKGEADATKKAKARVEGNSSSRGMQKVKFDELPTAAEMRKRLLAGEA